jgi:molybdopterin synthase catalytic subunit
MYDYTALTAMEQAKDILQQALNNLTTRIKEVEHFSRILISHEIIPVKSLTDALHIAISCVHGMNYLLTWNCKPIANAIKRMEIERVCTEFNYVYPVICTPEELIKGD